MRQERSSARHHGTANSRCSFEQYFCSQFAATMSCRGGHPRLCSLMPWSACEYVAEVMAVGDWSIAGGRNAGLRAVVGVLSGAASAESLRREPHTHIAPSVVHLPALARRLMANDLSAGNLPPST